jgi:glycosyltransferase involved in cell wall biosynthesis
VCDDPTRLSWLGPVLLVCPWYRPTIGGVVEVADNLLRLFNDAGIQTHLLVTDHPTSRTVLRDPMALNLWRILPQASLFHKVNLKTIIGMLTRGIVYFMTVRNFIRSVGFRSIVLIYPSANVWPFLIMKSLSNCRLILSLHGNDVLQYEQLSGAERWFLRMLLGQADAITVPAIHVGEKALSIVSGKSLPIRLIVNSVNAEKFVLNPSSYHRTGPVPTLIHVSNFNPKKRVTDIIEAFALSRTRDKSYLLMVGDGPDFQLAMQLTKELGIENRVTFAGNINDVYNILRGGDVFVMASDEEACPIALLEAMACRLPFISTNIGVAATFPPGECGLLVPHRSPNHLGEAMADLIEDPDKRKRMGERGRALVESSFTEEKYLQSHIEILREVMRDSGNGSSQ